MAAGNSPFAYLNCSSSMLPKRGSGVPTLTVYINFFTWWYTKFSSIEEAVPAFRPAAEGGIHAALPFETEQARPW